MIRQKTYRLNGTGDHPEAAHRARSGHALTLVPFVGKPGWFEVINFWGQRLGHLSNRHPVSRDIFGGRKLLHASVNCINSFFHSGEPSITVRLVTGEPGDTFPEWTPGPLEIVEKIETPVGAFKITITAPAKSYDVAIEDESYRQPVIRKCAVGDRVELVPEANNVFDERAVAVYARNLQIGYLPTDGWLTSEILDEGSEVLASIGSIAMIETGYLKVTLKVKISRP